MKKLSICVFAVVLCLGATALLANSGQTIKRGENSEARFAADGAFRDGLYVGRLAAEHGQRLRPVVGRWSTNQDRSMFAAGYRRGYNETFAQLNGEIAQPVD